MIGNHYGKWIVMGPAPKRPNIDKKYWLCRCECGNISEIRTSDLNGKKSIQCRQCSNKTHGMKYTKVYQAWTNMKKRCYDPNSDSYEYYGERGITVCKRWMKFENFYADMGESPKGMSLDRINSDDNYKPSNCRWATLVEQRNNRRDSRKAKAA